MAERVKLEEPGSSLVIKINRVTKENVQNADYYLFSNGNKEILVPVNSVSRQLANMEITDVQVLIGRVMKLSRSTKLSRYGKPFWDLAPASDEEAKAVSAAIPATGNPAGAAGAAAPSKSYTQLYKAATEFVLKDIVPLYKVAGLPVDAMVVKECVATVFIAKTKES
jgi:hypothetical protein